jgi:hypothetical protein
MQVEASRHPTADRVAQQGRETTALRSATGQRPHRDGMCGVTILGGQHHACERAVSRDLD